MAHPPDLGPLPSYDAYMEWRTWYDQLAKPSWTPSPPTIGLIWGILYPIILVTYGFVLYEAIRGRVPWPVALPFIINLIANLTFTTFLFRLRNLPLATVDIFMVLATIAWTMAAIWPHFRLIAIAQLPYLAWVSIATVLQVSIAVHSGPDQDRGHGVKAVHGSEFLLHDNPPEVPPRLMVRFPNFSLMRSATASSFFCRSRWGSTNNDICSSPALSRSAAMPINLTGRNAHLAKSPRAASQSSAVLSVGLGRVMERLFQLSSEDQPQHARPQQQPQQKRHDR
jgi:tryptophan-rich sensory protein